MLAPRRKPLILLALAACLAFGAVVADDPKKGSEAEKAPAYTNEDLERMFGKAPERKADPAAADKAGDGKALEEIKEYQAQDRSRRKRIEQAKKGIATIEAKIKQLEERRLQIRNPFLPRPQISEEDKAEWDQLDNAERYELTGKQLDVARAELKKAQAALRRLEASPKN